MYVRFCLAKEEYKKYIYLHTHIKHIKRRLRKKQKKIDITYIY
jgi:hypothetical protein